MRYLLLPDEERVLQKHLREQLGLIPLGAANEITEEFLDMRSPGNDHYFWCREIGPMRTLGDAPAPRDAKETVLRMLNRAADPPRWRDLIDLAHTPVICWHRPRWLRKGCVIPGRLGAMATTRKQQPPALQRLHAQIDRWLRKPATKVNPFRHCSGLPRPEPPNLATFWVAAWPKAKVWIDGGGELWPWDA